MTPPHPAAQQSAVEPTSLARAIACECSAWTHESRAARLDAGVWPHDWHLRPSQSASIATDGRLTYVTSLRARPARRFGTDSAMHRQVGSVPTQHYLTCGRCSSGEWPRRHRALTGCSLRSRRVQRSQSVLGCSTPSCAASATRVRPNHSLNRTRYGKRRKPGLRHMVHHLSPGLRRLPPRAG